MSAAQNPFRKPDGPTVLMVMTARGMVRIDELTREELIEQLTDAAERERQRQEADYDHNLAFGDRLRAWASGMATSRVA